MGEIRHIVNPHVAYGLSHNYDETTGEFDYLAAFQVERAADIPSGMVSWEVPAQMYALFPCTLKNVREVFHQAYHTWLPKSGYQLGAGPDFEYYDEDFDPNVEGSGLTIYIPVK
jgi:AraC family transcriptional regulator